MRDKFIRRNGRLRKIGRRSGIARGDPPIHLRDRIQGSKDRAPDRRPARRHQALQAPLQQLYIACWRLDQFGKTGKCHDPDLPARPVTPDEFQSRILRHLQTIGLDVRCAHAPRHVNRQDDGRLIGRDGHRGDRSPQCKHQARKCEQEQDERQMPPQPGLMRSRLAHQRQTRIPHRETPATSQQEDICRDHKRDQQKQG